jgi:hypothetical protein
VAARPEVIEPETPTERAIVADPEWQAGAAANGRMKGHPEETVGHHIAEVLANVDRYAADDEQRARLRLVALVHDTFKHRVRWWLPHRADHARIAAHWAQRHIDDAGVLLVVEVHDEGYRAWRRRDEGRVARLLERLGPELPLFEAFYRCDNETGDKAPDDRRWFEALVERRLGSG